MAKFNSPAATMKTTNKSGHASYTMTDRAKLVNAVLTSFFNEKKFYGDNSKEMKVLIPKVIKADPAFVAKLAVFARREFNMRSVAHVLTAFLAHEVDGKPYVRDTVRGVSVRGDDVTEIMACYLSMFGKPIPNALKKGIADVLRGMDEYSLAKYKGENSAVKMRDLLCLCRPTPKSESQSNMWKRCLEGKLETPETWETQLSANGNNRETWEHLIDGGKVGYMALLRNLRNIMNAKPRNMDKVLNKIADPVAVKKSRQLPFRYLSAYKSVGMSNSKVLDALENAVDAAIDNLPKLPGKTVIAVDVSGSMSSLVSKNSDIRCVEIGMMLGLIASRICEDAVFYTFDTNIRQHSTSKRNGILYSTMNELRYGGGTNMYLPFQAMKSQRLRPDRLIILSDNECNTGGGYYYRSNPVQAMADDFRRETGCNLWVHAIDLEGYGTQQFFGGRTNYVAGWSEKVFDFILLAEQGEGNLEKTIANYRW